MQVFTFFAENSAEKAILHVPAWHWGILVGWFLLLIVLDLFVFHRNDKLLNLRAATIQSFIWIGLAIALGLLFWPLYGASASGMYFSGYVIEKALSIDNVFAWSVVLSYFAVPRKYQHRVLYWGIFGALAMRAIFIVAGISLIERFEPILILFGLVLLYSGVKLLTTPEKEEFDPAGSKVLNWFKHIFPVSHGHQGGRFFVRENGKRMVTLLFLALLAVELTDILFAVDSVPAILAISRDPFIVFASNAAAILGLRSLFFVFEAIKDKFWLLTHALGILLVLISIKMMLGPHEVFGHKWFAFSVPTAVNLAVILGMVGGAIILSLLIPEPKKNKKAA